MQVIGGDPQFPRQEMPTEQRQKIFYAVSDDVWNQYKDQRFVAIAIASKEIIASGYDYRMVGDEATQHGVTFILAISKFYHDQTPVHICEMPWPTESELADIRSAMRQIADAFKERKDLRNDDNC